jgi:ribosomal protein S18 acetylase RimI-like enzyme
VNTVDDALGVVELRAEHADAVTRFFAELPDGDLTFIKEDVTEPATVRAWVRAEAPGRRWVALDDAGRVLGYVAVRPLPGWSDHVGEIRLVVHPEHRRRSLGRTLARHALVHALDAGLVKVVVELVADQEHALAMFAALGFTGETLLRDHIRDRDGALRDVVVMAHHVDETWSAMTNVGLSEEEVG